MKRTAYLILSILIAITTLNSCGDDDDSVNPSSSDGDMIGNMDTPDNEDPDTPDIGDDVLDPDAELDALLNGNLWGAVNISKITIGQNIIIQGEALTGVIVFTLPIDIEEGTFSLLESDDLNVVYADSMDTFIVNSGTITIDNHDTEENILDATFEFSVRGVEGNNVINVTGVINGEYLDASL